MRSSGPPSPQSPREHPNLSWDPHASQGAPVEEEPQTVHSQVPQAEPADSTEFSEAGKAEGKAKDVGLVSSSLIKIHNLPKLKRNKARAIAPTTKKPEEQPKTGKEHCGLCCIVIPSCQRFNNIHCFLVFLYMLLISQGEPGVGWGGVWGGGE